MILSDLRSALDRLTRPPLAGVAAAAMLALLLVVVGTHATHLQQPSGGKIQLGTGDFLAFWTGAVALHEGNGGSLYDFAAQKQLQSRILGGVSPEFQPYLNPPLLAILLSPLVPLGYLPVFFLYDLVCVVFLAAGLVLLRRLSPAIAAERGAAWTMVFVIASWQPMLQTTLGGQNTPVTFALLAALAAALSQRSARWAALVLGLLTYKPQYAVGAGIALLLAGRWRVIAGGAAIGILHWLAGAWWSGLRWPLDMLAFMRVYRPMELADNAETHFSWIRTADFVLPSPADDIVALVGVMAVLAAWWRFRELGRRGDPLWMALVVCGTMMASPHQQFYDVALLALPVTILVNRHLARHGTLSLRARLLLAAAYAGYPAWAWATALHFQPLFVVLLGVSVWALRACREAEQLADSRAQRANRLEDIHATA